MWEVIRADVKPLHEGCDLVNLILDAVDSSVVQLEGFQVDVMIVIRR